MQKFNTKFGILFKDGYSHDELLGTPRNSLKYSFQRQKLMQIMKEYVVCHQKWQLLLKLNTWWLWIKEQKMKTSFELTDEIY